MSIAINDIAIPTPLIYPAPVAPVARPEPGRNDLRRRGGLTGFNDYYMHAGGGAAVLSLIHI